VIMDSGVGLGPPQNGLELQQQERQNPADEDCYHAEGDDNFKVPSLLRVLSCSHHRQQPGKGASSPTLQH